MANRFSHLPYRGCVSLRSKLVAAVCLLAVLIAVACLVFGWNLGATRLWDVDEAIFSEAALEMMRQYDITQLVVTKDGK